MDTGFKEAHRNFDVDLMLTCDDSYYFVYGGQVFVVFCPPYEDFALKLMKYNSCSKTLNEVWATKITDFEFDFEYLTNIVADNNDRYIYLIGLKNNSKAINALENAPMDSWIHEISRHIFIVKINMETYTIEGNHCITSSAFQNPSDFRVCCNLEKGELYFFSSKELSAYCLKTRKMVSLPLLFGRGADFNDKVEIYWSGGSLYLFLIIEQTLYIRKLDPQSTSKVPVGSFRQQLSVRTYDFDHLNGKIPCCLTSTLISSDKVQLCVQLVGPDDDRYLTQILQYFFSTEELKHICNGPRVCFNDDLKIVAVPSYIF